MTEQLIDLNSVNNQLKVSFSKYLYRKFCSFNSFCVM